MEKELISGKQLRNLISVYLLGAALVTSGSVYAHHGAWISEISAFIIAIPIILMYARLGSIHRDKDIYDLFYDSLGRFVGITFSIIFLIYSIYLGAGVLRNFTEFVQVIFFPETPQYVTAIFAGLAILYNLKKGIEVLGRALSSIAFLLLAMTLITILFSIKDMDYSNIYPLFAAKPMDLVKETYFLLTLPYLETVMFLGINSNIKSSDSLYKAYLFGIITGGVFLLLTFFRNLFVLGTYVMESMYFPAYTAISLINIADFITRIEVIAAANYTFAVTLQTAICILTACKGLTKLTKTNSYKPFATPIVLLTIYLSKALFRSTMDLFDVIKKYRFPILLVQTIIPFITYIATEIRYRKSKGQLKAATKTGAMVK